MPPEPAERCQDARLIEAYARRELGADAARRAERLLERDEACRAYFRELTAGLFPIMPNYTILAQIGAGGFGVVYKAVHHGKERIEALKVLFSKTAILTSYFEREVHAIARLQHPRIATLYEAQLSTPPFYYTMEFVDGARLNEHLRGPLGLAERLRIVRTVALDLHYAHSQGVVHRDVKPQNILIDASGAPHIVDFGISVQLGREEIASRGEKEGPLGTVGYIAPEQLAGQAVDGRADVYALGALLFTSVTNEPVRFATDSERRLAALAEREISRADDLDAIIARCMARDAQERYASCAEFVEDLDRYLSGRAVLARRDRSLPTHGKQVARLVFRNYQIPLRVAMVLIAATLVTGTFWKMGAQALATADFGDQTVMIGFRPETIQAIRDGEIGADIPGLSAENSKSWRTLHGRMMERLARVKPLVVVWDFYFPDCTDFDHVFIAGVSALREVGTPVVVGASRFDINGEPTLCPDIRGAANAFGSLHVTNPDLLRDQYQVTYCLERGFEDPVPSLAVAAYAAARNPDCRARLQLHPDELRLELRYSMLQPVEGAPRTREPESLDLQLVERVPDRHARQGVWTADLVGHARIRQRPSEYWARKTYAYEDVLLAEDNRLRGWFEGRAIVFGQMLPGVDQHAIRGGGRIFGCQVQAEALDALLARSQPHRLTPMFMAWRTVIWCGLAAALVSARRSRYWRSLRGVAFSCVAIVVTALLSAAQIAVSPSSQYVLELALAASSMLVAGSAVFLVKAIGERFTQLAPPTPVAASTAPPGDGDTATQLLSDTVVQTESTR